MARAIIPLLLICLIAAPAAAACDTSIAPIDGPDGYRLRAGGQRCEGFFVSPVAGTTLELVSLTRGPLSWDAKGTGVLSIALAARPPLPGDPVHVQASGVPQGLYYRMDADISPAGSLAWPVGEVLEKSGIAPDQVGVLAVQRDQDGRPVYLAVDVGPQGRTSQAGAAIVAVLRVLTLIDDPQWRFVPHAGAASPLQPAELDGDRLQILLMPADVLAGGELQIVWNDVSTGAARIARMPIGG